MKNIRLLFAVTSCLLLPRSTCHAEDPKSTSVNVDLRQNKAVNERTLHVRPLTAIPSTKSSPNNLRNQNPAIIRGSTDKFRNASAINGTGMKRKP
jgi:hypothetical protein